MSEFVFSIDLEMGIGIEHFVGKKKIYPEIERTALPKILNLCKKYYMPITVAVCGHLFLDSCKGHDDMPKPQPDYYEGEWYKNDPKSSFSNNKSWYAPDLVEMLIESNAEIASHSFSHIPFNYCSEEVAEAEVKECIRLAKEKNISLKTFIFPRNVPRHLDVIKKHGFSHYVSFPQTKNFLISYKVARLSFNEPVENKEFNLIEVPRTIFFDRTKWRDLQRISLLLKLAEKRNSFFHLWSHGFNISTPTELSFLEKVFKKANSLGLEKKYISGINAKNYQKQLNR